MKDMGKQTEHLKLKVLRALGMAQRAGRLASGEFRNKCEFYEVPFVCFSTMGELGKAIGKEQRASLALCDEGFTKAVLALLEQIGGEQDEG